MKKLTQSQTIYIKDWMHTQLHSKQQVSDSYYIALSNQIMQVFCNEEIIVSQCHTNRLKNVSVALSAWIQDLVSGNYVWGTFKKLYQKKDHLFLPFCEACPSEYYDEEVNEADIRFLLWYFMQLYCYKPDYAFIEPYSDELRQWAEKLLPILETAYEEAPESADFAQYFQESLFDNHDTLEVVSTWLYFHSYLLAPAHDTFCARIAEEAQNALAGCSQETIYRFIRTAMLKAVFTRPDQLTGSTYAEWWREIWNDNPRAVAIAESVVYREGDWNKIVAFDEDNVALEVIDSHEEWQLPTLALNHEMKRKLTEGAKRLFFSGICYNNEWHIDEFYTSDKMEEETAENDTTNQALSEEEQRTRNNTYHELFLSHNNGSDLAYKETLQEVKDFLQAALNWAPEELDFIDDYRDYKHFVLFTDKEKGILIKPEIAEYIKATDNPYYNQEEALQNSLELYYIEGLCSEELLLTLEKRGMLPDASLLIPGKSEEEGHHVLMQYAPLLHRLFIKEG